MKGLSFVYDSSGVYVYVNDVYNVSVAITAGAAAAATVQSITQSKAFLITAFGDTF